MEIIIIGLYIIVFIYSVILHEVAHGWVANRFGDDTAKISGRLTLNPIPHIDVFGSIVLPVLLYIGTGFTFGYAKPVPVNPFRLQGGTKSYRWVTLAGILTNFSLAIIAGIVLRLVNQTLFFGPENLGVIFFQLIFVINLVLAVFNAMPFPGFDGYNFLMTFGWFSNAVRQTPLANPLFMAKYGLFVSLMILILIWPFVGHIIGVVINFFAATLGI
ncbi:MAG: site-2 protease family protein [Candidatus Buchananbacteria bacterium]|nr:site-2 protease family protein [Candidatus Buchananbacteria bacterium]